MKDYEIEITVGPSTVTFTICRYMDVVLEDTENASGLRASDLVPLTSATLGDNAPSTYEGGLPMFRRVRSADLEEILSRLDQTVEEFLGEADSEGSIRLRVIDDLRRRIPRIEETLDNPEDEPQRMPMVIILAGNAGTMFPSGPFN
jgi:hypothetical protein